METDMSGSRFSILVLVMLIGIFMFLSLNIFLDQNQTEQKSDKQTIKTRIMKGSLSSPKKIEGDIVIEFTAVKVAGRIYTLSVIPQSPSGKQYDTAEVVIRIPSQIFEVTNITDGTFLDFCPRKQIEKDLVRITCVSKADTTSGSGNQPIFHIRLYLKEPFDKGKIEIDETNTKIYFKGQEITRYQSAPFQIHL